MNKHFNDYKSVFGYTVGRLKANTLLNSVCRIYRYARSYLLISKIIRILATVLTIIEASATLIVIGVMLALLIPLSFITLEAFHIIGLASAKRKGLIPKNLIHESSKIMFIKSGKHYFSKKAVYQRYMSESFSESGYTVFIINKNLFIGGVSTIKCLKPNLYEIKIGYFYYLKKYISRNKIKADITYIS
ncbi:MAG: hypothetical protein PUB34_05820 [Clostridia bacterium]|nr:hypothetical protein [Clostridia bacterium]